ncbi:type II toxin-antitoxin system CcdA family antitoxin [Methanoculleus chikugoensis]|uniref:type II toxin-antitoxin system CcdA family antitoxin n=1 Tax=Methanoculleus chikugoensis TaxID=118126 RepID=UPI000943ECD4
MSDRTRGGRTYSPTCLQIDASLKVRAKEAGINMSRTLRDALEAKLKEIEDERGCNAPTSLPSRQTQPAPAAEASR